MVVFWPGVFVSFLCFFFLRCPSLDVMMALWHGGCHGHGGSDGDDGDGGDCWSIAP